MSLEAATYVSDLVTTNPVSSDNVSQGDDHLRLLKAVLQATLPSASKPFYFPTTSAKSADFTITGAAQNTTFLITTTSGAVVATLPSLTTGDAGWECFFIKVTADTNAYFIAPASGTIQSGAISGLSRTRRCIPGAKTRVFWTGTAWIAERVVSVPVGTTLEFCGASLPVGYEWPNGQTLASASTNYPDFYSANGNSGVVLDDRGRVTAGKDDMGGASADRLTNQSGGLNGDTLGATGGEETHTLTAAESAVLTYTSDVTDPGHNHTYSRLQAASAGAPGGGNNLTGGNSTVNTSTATTGITVATTSNAGGGAHNNVQPTIIKNKILVVE